MDSDYSMNDTSLKNAYDEITVVYYSHYIVYIHIYNCGRSCSSWYVKSNTRHVQGSLPELHYHIKREHMSLFPNGK